MTGATPEGNDDPIVNQNEADVDGSEFNLGSESFAATPTSSSKLPSRGTSGRPFSNELLGFLAEIGQEHLTNHFDEIPHDAQVKLVARLHAIAWNELKNEYVAPELSQVSPSTVVSLEDRKSPRLRMERIGDRAYRDGEVAVLMVAGGDGVRLGSTEPKGCYPIGPVSGKSIYQIITEKIVRAGEESGTQPPFVVMTSPRTHEPTVRFFEQNSYFGLDPKRFITFTQATVPTTDQNGGVLLKNPGEILENPSGHGGCLVGLYRTSVLDWLQDLGVRDVLYMHVDNLLLPVHDKFAIGLRRAEGTDMVTKVVKKFFPEEKMGSLVRIDGRDSVVEYSDLTTEQQHMKDSDGNYLFGWGNMGSHIFGVDFLVSLKERDYHLPFHKAKKQVVAWNGSSHVTVEGIKRERFVFDVIPEARNIALEIDRSHEFAPVKNATGIDSAESARVLMSGEYARWLETVGVKVELPKDAFIEISPRFAAHFSEFQKSWARLPNKPTKITESYFLDG